MTGGVTVLIGCVATAGLVVAVVAGLIIRLRRWSREAIRLREELAERDREVGELRQQNVLLDEFHRSVPGSASLIDMDGTVLLSNAGAGRQISMDPAQIVGRHYTEPLSEKAKRNIEELMQQVQVTKDLCFKEDHLGDRYYASYANPVLDDAGEIYRVGLFSHDVTEPRKDFETVQESESKLRVLLENSPSFIATVDGDGRITYLNYEMPDFTREEMVGRHFNLRIREDDRARMNDAISTVVNQNKATQLDVVSVLNRFYTFQIIPLLDQPDGSRAMLIGTETTEIRAAERELRELNERLSRSNEELSDSNNRLMESNSQLLESQRALRASEQQLRSIVENVAEIIFTIDPDGMFTYVAPGWTRLLGHDPDEVTGQHLSRFVADDNRPDLEADFYRVLHSREKLTIKEHRIGHKDGSWRDFRSSLTPVRGVDGRTQFFVGISEDITDQLLMERRIRQVQKMEALGTLAGGIAHDFNNILYALMGYTKMALDDTEESGIVHVELEEIMTGLKRAADLVNQILSFSRQSKTERSELDLGLIVGETIGLVKATIPAGVILHTDLQPAAPIWANPTEVHQVLMNLITNALRAMPDGGTLGICLNMVEVSPQEVAVYGLEPGSYSRLTISDTGIGMSEEVKERIFDPFFTTREVGQGTGMGLSVSHGIISDLGGKILVDSQPGEGTVFTVMVPGVEQSQGAAYDPADHHTYRVMIVIKGVMEQEMYGRMFKRHGFSSFGFSSPTAALTDLAAAPDAYDLLLTDEYELAQHPRLVEEARSVKPGLPVLHCSSAGQGQAGNAGPDDATAFLTKPVGHRRLIAETRRLLGLPH